MMKKILCLALVLTFCAVLPAVAEGVQPVTAEELDTLLADVRTKVQAGEVLNDPADEAAQNEDGTLFWFENAKVYAAGESFTAETPVNALVIEDGEGAVFRSVWIASPWENVLAAFPNDNAELAGTRDAALLYLTMTEDGFTYGRILRDGQRVTAVEYGEVLPVGENFRRAAVTFDLQDGLVSAVRTDGLNPEDGLMDAPFANEFLKELEALKGRSEYRAVKISNNGLELTPFDEKDLSFNGIFYPALQPDSLSGEVESDLIDSEDGTWLLRCENTEYEAVFTCEANGENARILSLSIRDEMIEGPRHVRLGDLFSDDYRRFRSGENEMDENMMELLYGSEGTAPWGSASYNESDEEMILQYVTTTEEGAEVMLILRYKDNYLTEIMLQTL